MTSATLEEPPERLIKNQRLFVPPGSNNSTTYSPSHELPSSQRVDARLATGTLPDAVILFANARSVFNTFTASSSAMPADLKMTMLIGSDRQVLDMPLKALRTDSTMTAPDNRTQPVGEIEVDLDDGPDGPETKDAVDQDGPDGDDNVEIASLGVGEDEASGSEVGILDGAEDDESPSSGAAKLLNADEEFDPTNGTDASDMFGEAPDRAMAEAPEEMGSVDVEESKNFLLEVGDAAESAETAEVLETEQDSRELETAESAPDKAELDEAVEMSTETEATLDENESVAIAEDAHILDLELEVSKDGVNFEVAEDSETVTTSDSVEIAEAEVELAEAEEVKAETESGVEVEEDVVGLGLALEVSEDGVNFESAESPETVSASESTEIGQGEIEIEVLEAEEAKAETESGVEVEADAAVLGLELEVSDDGVTFETAEGPETISASESVEIGQGEIEIEVLEAEEAKAETESGVEVEEDVTVLGLALEVSEDGVTENTEELETATDLHTPEEASDLVRLSSDEVIGLDEDLLEDGTVVVASDEVDFEALLEKIATDSARFESSEVLVEELLEELVGISDPEQIMLHGQLANLKLRKKLGLLGSDLEEMIALLKDILSYPQETRTRLLKALRLTAQELNEIRMLIAISNAQITAADLMRVSESLLA